MRALGNTGLQVAPWCLGGNVLGWTADESTSFSILDAFRDAGCNFIDTADMYAVWAPPFTGGNSETVIGNWLKQRGGRDKLVIATKVGLPMGPGLSGLGKEYIISSAEASLKRLQTDHIDLYYAHTDDVQTPIEETLEAFARLIRDGKVGVLGVSKHSAARLKESLETSARAGLPSYQVIQPHYNLYARQDYYEGEVERICLEHGIGVAPHSALASGFLTGKYRSMDDLGLSPRGAGVKKFLNERGFRILGALDQVAADYGATPGKIAVAWVLSKPGVAAAVASANSAAQAEDLIASMSMKLSPESLTLLDEASA